MSVPERFAELTAIGGRYEMTPGHDGAMRRWRHGSQTLRQVMVASRAYGARPFMVLGDDRWTFDSHYRAVAALADHLIRHAGGQPGDRVAIAMRNLPEWSVAFWATVSVGGIAVPLNAWWPAADLAFALEDSGACILVADEERAARVADAGDVRLEETLVVGDESPAGTVSFHRTLTRSEGALLPDVSVAPDQDATLYYTSGTTGRPKGVLGTHYNMASCLLSRQIYRELELPEPPTLGGVAHPAATLLTVPLFHVTGTHAYLLPALANGSMLVLMHKWDRDVALELIDRHGVAAMGGVPFMAIELLEALQSNPRELATLRAISVGGAPCPPALVARLARELPTVIPGNGYGMTETSSVAIYNFGEAFRARPDALGHVVPLMDAAVVDAPASGLQQRGTGELWLRGANVARGYWVGPNRAPQPFGPDGWLPTGDLVTIDDENVVTLVGRSKEIVVRGGENISPVQVEAALLEHPLIVDAAVIGLPHPALGEELAAIVQYRPGDDPSFTDIVDHLRPRVPAFMIPAHLVSIREPLPRSAQGKLLRDELRAWFESRESGDPGSGRP